MVLLQGEREHKRESEREGRGGERVSEEVSSSITTKTREFIDLSVMMRDLVPSVTSTAARQSRPTDGGNNEHHHLPAQTPNPKP